MYQRKKVYQPVILLILFQLFMAACGLQMRTEGKKTSESVFLYMGDSQSDPENEEGYTAWGELLRRAAADAADAEAVLIGGDLVNDEADNEEWKTLFAASGGVFDTIPLYAASGNHTKNYGQWLKLPENGPPGFENLFYSFDLENVHITVTDSNSMGSREETTLSLLREWLRSDLEATDKPWKIVVMHHPMYPIGNQHKDQLRAGAMQENYLPVMEEAAVDIILCGHQHLYARTYPMRNGEVTVDGTGIIQLMGISGGKQYSAEKKNFVECFITEERVWTEFRVTESKLKLFTKNADGLLMDSYEISRNGAGK